MDRKSNTGISQENEKLAYYKALNDIANQIHSAKNTSEILINLKNQLGLKTIDLNLLFTFLCRLEGYPLPYQKLL